eukprot:gnl/Chilomastix_cuspidata/2635.p1 GENE.gnl/Chilomastix_cuspidata/2635~~gnl/Chilomastix_cuspidata/2635.p1  ORF type:complete len:337 (+),score=62.09 gnl/Chilomastix_cuspidata/2635:49-1059(+)
MEQEQVQFAKALEALRPILRVIPMTGRLVLEFLRGAGIHLGTSFLEYLSHAPGFTRRANMYCGEGFRKLPMFATIREFMSFVYRNTFITLSEEMLFSLAIEHHQNIREPVDKLPTANAWREFVATHGASGFGPGRKNTSARSSSENPSVGHKARVAPPKTTTREKPGKQSTSWAPPGIELSEKWRKGREHADPCVLVQRDVASAIVWGAFLQGSLVSPTPLTAVMEYLVQRGVMCPDLSRVLRVDPRFDVVTYQHTQFIRLSVYGHAVAMPTEGDGVMSPTSKQVSSGCQLAAVLRRMFPDANHREILNAVNTIAPCQFGPEHLTAPGVGPRDPRG